MPYYPNYGQGGVLPSYMQPVYPAYQQPQQSYTPSPQPQQNGGMIWVDGEVGAKAYQIPQGQTGPIALWDTNDTVIYLKSVNQMGMPNPLQKIHYTVEDQPPQPLLPMNQSGTANQEYATKNELEAIRQELMNLKKNNQNSSQSGQNYNNRGGQQ